MVQFEHISADTYAVEGATDWEALLAEHGGDGYAVVIDRDFVIRAASHSLLDRAGYGPEVLGTLTGLDMVHPDDLERAAAVIAEVAAIEGGRAEGMYRLRYSDGSHEQYSLRALTLGEAHDGAIVYQFKDADDRIRAEAFAEDVVAAMQLLVDEQPLDTCLDWISRIGERHVDGVQLVVTRFDDAGAATMFSRRPVPPQIEADNTAATSWNPPAHVQKVLARERVGTPIAFNLSGMVDDDYPGRVTILLKGKHGDVLGYVEALRVTTDEPNDAEWTVYALIRRIVEAVMHRHQLDAQLRHAADHDPLTGLVNRRRLLAEMESTSGAEGSALLLLDLDRFGWINNTLGHGAGDEALILAARCLLDACPPEVLISRIGGDEFVVWAPSLTSLDDLEKLGEAIREGLRAKSAGGEHRAHVRASIGGARRIAGESPTDLIRRADEAMYEAKRAGGDQIRNV